MDSNFCISRRKLLKSTCGFVGAAALASIGVSRSAFAVGGATQEEQPEFKVHAGMPKPIDKGAPQVGDVFVFGGGPHKDDVVSMEALVIDAPPVSVQAKDPASGTVRESDHSTILLYRVLAEKVPPEMKDYAPQGVLAYSAVCTHLGCLVSDWVEDTKLLVCPCHEAKFDPMQEGKVISGPAPRPLPILPLKVENGKLIVADVFTGTVGPKKS